MPRLAGLLMKQSKLQSCWLAGWLFKQAIHVQRCSELICAAVQKQEVEWVVQCVIRQGYFVCIMHTTKARSARGLSLASWLLHALMHAV
jgi:hypothetical protein